MRKFIFYIFLCIGTVQAAPQKNVAKKTALLTVSERKNILKELGDFLNKPEYNLPSIDLFFYTKETEEVVQEVIQPVEPPPKEIPASDHDMLVLRSVGKSINPDGSLESNGQHVLCLHGSHILKPGDILYARYKGNLYPIKMKSITRKQFTLEINDKELTFQY